MAKPKKCKCGCGSEIPNNWRSPFLNKDCQNKFDRSSPKRIELAEAKKAKINANQKKCLNCKKKVDLIVYGVWCSNECAEATKVKKLAKIKPLIDWQEEANQNWSKFKRKQKKETRSYQQELILTKRPFQRWCVLRDKFNGMNHCIACEKPFNDNKRDGGHHFKSELFSGVIFHPNNIFSECINCNQYNDGNLAQYTPNLIKKIGLDNFNHLKKLSLDYKVFSYPIDWLREFRAIIEEKIRKNDFDNSSILDKLAELNLN